jgi:hypothetical protein
MANVKLDEKEIDYLKTLVAEAWFYKRKSLMSEADQETLWKILDEAKKRIEANEE